jgi:hypothetical protein
VATISTTESIAVQRAHGIELIGEFEGSGFKVTPHLARRADGQVVQRRSSSTWWARRPTGSATSRRSPTS